MRIHEKSLFWLISHVIKQNTFSNNNKEDFAVTTQLVLSLLGVTELMLTCFKAIKAAFAFKFAFEQICRLKFSFNECKFGQLHYIHNRNPQEQEARDDEVAVASAGPYARLFLI